MDALENLVRQAEEAERLAGLVSYGLDKTRLLAQAAALRQRAAALKASGAGDEDRLRAASARRGHP